MKPLDEIAQIYYAATHRTIERDLARAVELLKMLPSEEVRERAAVYMDGLSQMRSEWAAAAPEKARRSTTSSRAKPAGGPAKASIAPGPPTAASRPAGPLPTRRPRKRPR